MCCIHFWRLAVFRSDHIPAKNLSIGDPLHSPPGEIFSCRSVDMLHDLCMIMMRGTSAGIHPESQPNHKNFSAPSWNFIPLIVHPYKNFQPSNSKFLLSMQYNNMRIFHYTTNTERGYFHESFDVIVDAAGVVCVCLQCS